MTDNQDLEARFASLRQQFEERAPSFDAVLRRAAAPRRASIGVSIIVATAASAVVGVFLVRRPFQPTGTAIAIPEVSVLGWKSPTDFLLATPDQAFLRTIPKFGQFPIPLPVERKESQPLTRQRSTSLGNNS